jgi:hypothetical protein
MFASTIDNSVLDMFPQVELEGHITLVTTRSQVQKAAEYLLRQPVLGFDTETKPRFSSGKMYKPALLQLSTGNRSFLIHLNKTGLPPELLAVLSDPRIVKVGAAVRDDIIGLQRYARLSGGKGFIDLTGNGAAIRHYRKKRQEAGGY